MSMKNIISRLAVVTLKVFHNITQWPAFYNISKSLLLLFHRYLVEIPAVNHIVLEVLNT